MARGSPAPSRAHRGRRARLVAGCAIVAALATVVTLAVTAQGYRAHQAPREDTSVWVTRDSGQYARVNTQLGQIDTVRNVDGPSGVAQDGSAAVVFGQGNRQSWKLDAANPANLVTSGRNAGGSGSSGAAGAGMGADAPAGASAASGTSSGRGTAVGADAALERSQPADATPTGTRDVVSSGGYIAYRTDIGTVFAGRIDGPLAQVDPGQASTARAGGAKTAYSATAVAVSPDGMLVAYSATEHAVRTYDIPTGRFLGGPAAIASAPSADAAVAMAIVGSTWALSYPARSRLWLSGNSAPIATHAAADAVLQSSAGQGARVLLADSRGLVAVGIGSRSASRVAQAAGVPAAPIMVGGTAYAAWISPGAGALWSSSDSRVRGLATDQKALAAVHTLTPVFRTSGSAVVLNETGSGSLWSVPDGTMIPLVEWNAQQNATQSVNTVQVQNVTQEKPPVAVDSQFGVRAGQQAILPVLYNAYDANKQDVLTIDPASLAGGLSDPGFGTLALAGNNQQIVLTVQATSGSATFSYRVTDGVMQSQPATVTVTVVARDTNHAPVWCGINACKQQWPTPQITPGGTVVVPVLNGWVDPESDPFVLADARKANPTDPVNVVPMADGSVAIRHTDPNAPDSVIPIIVTIEDSGGAQVEKTLNVTVTSSPAISAPPIAVLAGAGQSTTVRLADHLMGGSGSFRVVDAAPTSNNASQVSVVPNSAAGTIDLNAAATGQYVIGYTVQDTVTHAEQSGTIRLTVADAASPIALPPLTAFVRTNEDSTIDVLSAAQNTTGRVLSVSGVRTSNPGLSASVVDQAKVRVSGTTQTGRPGLVGIATVTVTDNAGAAVEGQLAVFLAPPATDVRPIAMPDAVTVRVRSQADIPVLANDVSPRGERLALFPKVEGAASGSLAFASGGDVRYLAPAQAGTYVLHYSIYLEDAPNLTDTSTVTVTVLPDGANRPPQPPILIGRVLSGHSVAIPVPSFGIDPDGDPVALTGVDQPGSGNGVAAISADGTSIVYTAPANGVPGGNVQFGYQVRDSQGAGATGQVKVGVQTAALADSAPVAYSDYVRVQQGSAEPVTVQPLLNDRDPSGGTLSLVSVVPNAPRTDDNPEYARLKSLIDGATSLKNGRVVLHAGNVAGPQSYVYTVESSASKSTAQGLIVVNVTQAPAPDAPSVADTIVTARDRDQLTQGGIDVVTGKVQWASGNVSTLELSVWGDWAKTYRVSGSRIIGPAPEAGALVPFQLTGKDSTGASVKAYAFLRIPAFNDMPVQLKPGVDPVSVGENKSATFDVRKLVDIGPSDTIALRQDSSYPVQRKNARCAPTGGTSVEYDAGSDAPWTDTCLVEARLTGQTSWSPIAVPIEVEPRAPQAILSSVTRSIAPGSSGSIDLYNDMTTWEGGRVGDKSKLDYAISYSGSSFQVTQKGTTITATAAANAVPGTRDSVRVSVAAFGGLTANITLVVGVAAPDAPRGATFTRSCQVSQGSGCAITVIGVPGEYDPFAGKTGSGLQLVGVGTGSSVSCQVATVTASGSTQVQVTWPSTGKPPGGSCVVPFTVADAQGRTGVGQLTVDIQGYPATPASITTTGYTGSSVTLSVALGDAANAHPALTGVGIYSGGSPVPASCSPGLPGTYTCTVGGLTNGQPRSYTARAVNAVGTSGDTTPVTTWAYQAPSIGALSATPVYRPGTTTQATGVASLSIASGSDTTSFRVDAAGTSTTISRTGATTQQDVPLPPGQQVITVTPISSFQPPIGGGTGDGSSATTTVTVAGAPYFAPNNPSATALTNTSVQVSGVSAQGNYSANPLQIVYVAWSGGGTPTCQADRNGTIDVSGGTTSSTSTISGLQEYTTYSVMACASNGFGVAQSGTASVFTFTSVDAPPGGSYSIGVDARTTSTGYAYDSVTPPNLPSKNGFTLQYQIYGNWIPASQFAQALSADTAPGAISARYCNQTIGVYCSNATTVTAATAPTIVTVNNPQQCLPQATQAAADALIRPLISQAARGAAAFAAPVASTDGKTAAVTISWTGSFAALKPLAMTVNLCSPPATGG